MNKRLLGLLLLLSGNFSVNALWKTTSRDQFLNSLFEARREAHVWHGSYFADEPKALTNLDMERFSLAGGIYGRAGKYYPVVFLSANFTGSNFKGMDLSGGRFINCNFTDVDMSGANLYFTDLEDAKMVRTKFGKVSWTSNGKTTDGIVVINRSSLKRAVFSGVTFDGTQILTSDFSHTNFKLGKTNPPTKFANCNITGSSFQKAQLWGVEFTGSMLENVSFVDAVLYKMIFGQGTKLTDIDFSGATLEFVDFSNVSQVGNINFSQAKLYGVKFPANISFDDLMHDSDTACYDIDKEGVPHLVNCPWITDTKLPIMPGMGG